MMSQEFGDQPWICDAGTLTWCHRPRLYWISWELAEQDGVCLEPGSTGASGRVTLHARQDLEQVCKEGWIKATPERSFPTFTTSRPRDHPGYKPAGLKTCTPDEVRRWEMDNFRYPPYQYTTKNLLINKRNRLRLPDIEEKEYIMGFPINYTLPCIPKASWHHRAFGPTSQPHWQYMECTSGQLVPWSIVWPTGSLSQIHTSGHCDFFGSRATSFLADPAVAGAAAASAR